MTLRCWRRTAASCSVRSRSDAGSSGDDVILVTWYGVQLAAGRRRCRLPARCSSCPLIVAGRCRFIACSRSRTVVVLMTSFPAHVTACDAANWAPNVAASAISLGFVLRDVIAWCVCALPSNSSWPASDFVLPDTVIHRTYALCCVILSVLETLQVTSAVDMAALYRPQGRGVFYRVVLLTFLSVSQLFRGLVVPHVYDVKKTHYNPLKSEFMGQAENVRHESAGLENMAQTSHW